MLLQTEPKATTPIQSSVKVGPLQRKSARNSISGNDGKQEDNLKTRLMLRHGTASETMTSIETPDAGGLLGSQGQPVYPAKREFTKPGFGHDFGKVQVYSNMPGRIQRIAYNGKSDCSPTWYGEVSPELDSSGERFTGKLVVKYNDAELKDPCVRECVELHESIHVKHLTPIVKKIHDCDEAAGNDWDKKEKCNAMANRELMEVNRFSECEAYRKSFTCLTLKVIDPSSPCSKPPHRDEIQKHRGHEGCEMKKACEEAGTPEAGIPNT